MLVRRRTLQVQIIVHIILHIIVYMRVSVYVVHEQIIFKFSPLPLQLTETHRISVCNTHTQEHARLETTSTFLYGHPNWYC